MSSEPVWILNHLHCKSCDPVPLMGNVFNRSMVVKTTHTTYRSQTMLSVIPVVFSGHRYSKPSSVRYRWMIHWRSVRGLRYPKLPTQTVNCYSTRGIWPIQDTEPQPASAGQDETSCESFGLSRSRRCSWGNHWKLAATPRRTQPTLVRSYQRRLRVRKCSNETQTQQSSFWITNSLEMVDLQSV